jgi:hypothetical protein
MATGAGWPDVAIALVDFAKTEPVTFLLTVPLTGIVIIAGALVLMRIGVIRPISALSDAYDRRRQQHRDPELPLS